MHASEREAIAARMETTARDAARQVQSLERQLAESEQGALATAQELAAARVGSAAAEEASAAAERKVGMLQDSLTKMQREAALRVEVLEVKPATPAVDAAAPPPPEEIEEFIPPQLITNVEMAPPCAGPPGEALQAGGRVLKACLGHLDAKAVVWLGRIRRSRKSRALFVAHLLVVYSVIVSLLAAFSSPQEDLPTDMVLADAHEVAKAATSR
jgi:hypothetical protein